MTRKKTLAIACGLLCATGLAQADILDELRSYLEEQGAQQSDPAREPTLTGADGQIAFTGVKTPASDVEKRAVLSSQYAFVDGKQSAIDYHTILRSGEKGSRADSDVFGRLYDRDGNVLKDEEGNEVISNSNDFASLLHGANANDNILYMVSHFESRPGAMYLTELKQGLDGNLSALRTRNIDFSAVEGGWVHCAGSVTPWDTHLGSEEYEPDASSRDPNTGSIDDYYDAMGDYFGGDLMAMNPYDYGFNVEVAVSNYNNVDVTKHYAMGRVAIELAYVMPNERTAYITDDGTNVGLYRFEADQPGDLSSGTLYAAKWNQTSADGVGSANLSWVDLGHATNDQVKQYIDNGTTFFDIFDRVDPDANGCPTGYTEVNHTYGHECLMLKSGMELAASRLETRRYAAMMGATTEWRKMEGITFDADKNRLYLAISEVARGMEDFTKNGSPSDSYDLGGPNDIRVRYNNCGAVYALDVNDNYTAYNMYGVVAGRPTQANDPESDLAAYDPAGPFANNKCDLEGISNPDNVTYMPGYNTLIIGEDTGSGHQNDIIWSFDTDSGELTRIQTTPYGSETTSPYFYPDINGWGYLMSVIQHPYGESDGDKLDNVENGDVAARGYTGYVGPFPSMSRE